MSYTLADAVPTGNIFDDIANKGKELLGKGKDLLGVAGNAVAAGKAILDDPYLPEVTTLVMRLKAHEQKSTKGSGGGSSKGVGLKSVVTPLRFYVTTKENPVVGMAAVAGILAIPFLAGYFIGKKR